MSSSLQHFKADIFQGLAHPTRVAIVEQLREGELCVGELVDRLGLDKANASQHLAILRHHNIVTMRREGNHVFYAIRNHALIEVLDILKRYLHAQLIHTLAEVQEARQVSSDA
ncbi:MAG: metalloregulator ArsR/SmtB family transcription factor [Armatimonas sp.]